MDGLLKGLLILLTMKVGISIAAIVLLFTYWGGLADLLHRWNTMEEYSYGYFIPLITTFLIYQQKQQLLSVEYRSSWMGVLLMLLAAVLFFMGGIATTYTLIQYSLVLLIMGIALALLGWRVFKIVVGPLALLFFMVPFPPFVLNTLSGQLQLISSEIGVWVIRLFGISVFLEGNVIDLGTYQLQVVEACSGLNYLFPLISITFIIVYLYKVEFWKRALVFLSSIPITVLMNSFRIGVIGWLVENWGIDQAEGFLHYFEGWIIFVFCLAIILIEIVLLSHIGQQMSLAQALNLKWPDILPDGFQPAVQKVSSVHYGMAGAVLLLLVVSLYIKGQEEIHPERAPFENFPQQVGEWIGKDDKLETIYLDSLKLDDYFLADFKNPFDDLVNFYVAYYESQQAGSAAHSPRSCIPGGGWEIEEVTQVDLADIRVNGEALNVNRLVIKRGEYKQLVYYWFQQRGRVMTNEWLVKWYLFLDGLTKRRTDGALVRLTTSIGVGEEWADGDKRLMNFSGKVVPLLDQYIPD
ncbi:MAG: VPLPA-CTERM-specific exosortase XrtD [Candidatus Thiodiazotropha endolucinida]